MKLPHRNSGERLKIFNSYYIVVLIYILGILGLSYLTVRSYLSPFGFSHAPEAWDMQNDCAQSAGFPDCLHDVIDFDFTYVWAYHGLAYHNHDWVAQPAWESGEIGIALVAESRFLYNIILFYLLNWSPLPFLLGWTILFGYLLIYQLIKNIDIKWIEAIITGWGIAFLLWFINRYQPLPGPDSSLSPSIIGFSIVYLVIWFLPDLMTRRIDNILAKAILFVGTMVAFAIFSYDSLLKILVIPIFTLVLSFGFGYWKQLKNHRQQIAILVYITLFIGVAAAIAKHWQFFISGIFTGQFERADLGELINDFIIFFLGFLLTYLEMEQEAKEPIQSEQYHSSTDPISIPQQPPPAGKRFSFFMPTLIGALIGAVTIIYLRFFLRVHES